MRDLQHTLNKSIALGPATTMILIRDDTLPNFNEVRVNNPKNNTEILH